MSDARKLSFNIALDKGLASVPPFGLNWQAQLLESSASVLIPLASVCSSPSGNAIQVVFLPSLSTVIPSFSRSS